MTKYSLRILFAALWVAVAVAQTKQPKEKPPKLPKAAPATASKKLTYTPQGWVNLKGKLVPAAGAPKFAPSAAQNVANSPSCDGSYCYSSSNGTWHATSVPLKTSVGTNQTKTAPANFCDDSYCYKWNGKKYVPDASTAAK